MPFPQIFSRFLSTAPAPHSESLTPIRPSPECSDCPPTTTPRSSKQTSKSSSPTSPPPTSLSNYPQQKIYFLKSILLLIIVTAGGLTGGLSYYFIREYQSRFYHEEFDNMVLDSMRSIKESIYIKLQVNIQLSIALGLACPTTAHWPNCAIPSQEFIDRTHSLLAISHLDSFLYLPIVSPESRSSFETFALNYFQEDGNYPSGAGISSVGPRIYTYSPDGQQVISPDHTNSSAYDILLPILQLTDVTNQSSLLLYDAHSDLAMGPAVDDVLDCVSETISQRGGNQHFIVQSHCGGLTDYIPTFDSKYSAIGVPIFPSQNQTEVVGFTGALFSWASLLTTASRIDSTFFCKIESASSNVDLLFEVTRGHVKEKQKEPSPAHEQASGFDRHLTKSFVLNGDSFPGGTGYTITYYSTENPPAHYLALISCLCCIVVSIFISLSFELFNAIIKREADGTNQLLDSKRVFVRFVSHEIRTPLNTINLGLRVLQENLKSLKDINDRNDDCEIVDGLLVECQDLVAELDGNSSLAVTTLNDLINYDKIETKTFSIDKKPVDMWSVVEKTVNLLTLQAKEKKVTFRLRSQLLNPSSFRSVPDAGSINLKNLRVIGDVMKLGQVIRNLVSNALKFTPAEGKVDISVIFEPQYIPATSTRRPIISWNQSLFESTSVASEPVPEIVGFITVTVTDSGPGLSKEQQKLLFREGVQFNPNELQAGQGSGLGLWITREIVCLHNGSISARSEGLGKGSSFILTVPVVVQELPVAVDPVPKPVSPRASHGESGTSQVGGRSSSLVSSFESREHHVLVADDAASNRKLVCRLLRSKGYICHEAENGFECVQMIMAADYSYEFIVLDYEMPVLDGPSAARRLRENRSDVLIIGVTGNVLPEDQEYFIRQGANAVLPKPLDITRLLEEVHHATRPPV